MTPNFGNLNKLVLALRALDPKSAGFTFNMEYAVHEDEDGNLCGDYCLVWFAVCEKVAADEVWSGEFEANKQIFERFSEAMGLHMGQVESLLYPAFLWKRDEETPLSDIRASDAAHTLERYISALIRDPEALASWDWYEHEILIRKVM